MWVRYVLPCWVVGVVVSFALPLMPHWTVWLAAGAVSAGLAWRFRPLLLLLCVLAGMVYGVWRTEAALARQWPLGNAKQVVLTVEVAVLP